MMIDRNRKPGAVGVIDRYNHGDCPIMLKLLLYLKVYLRPNTLICPRLSAAIFVCAEDVVKMGVFCIMANFMFYIGTHSIGTCASLLHIIIIIIIKPLLKMNVEV